jgi:hypothetical protein
MKKIVAGIQTSRGSSCEERRVAQDQEPPFTAAWLGSKSSRQCMGLVVDCLSAFIYPSQGSKTNNLDIDGGEPEWIPP